jgi:hypothetical protein
MPLVTDSDTSPPWTRTREELHAILVSRGGDLRAAPYRHLLLAIFLSERSVVLTLRRNQLQKEIIFDSGAAVDCHSNIATESLGRFLVSAGKISDQDAHDALNASTSRGVPLDDILIEKNLIAPTDLYRALQQSLARKLLEPFSWTSGSWSLSFDVPRLTSSLRVKVPQLLVTGAAKVEPQETIDAAVAQVESQRLITGASPLVKPDELRLSPDQEGIADGARRGMLVAELRAALPIAPEEQNRILAPLLLVGLVSAIEPSAKFEAAPAPPMFTLDELPPLLDEPPPPPRQRTVLPPEPPPFAARPVEAGPRTTPPRPPPAGASAEQVIASYLTFRRKDAFELLGVPLTAGGGEITRAFLTMSDRFHPSKYDELASEGLRDKAQEIFLAAARAYGELSDATRREALIAERDRKRNEAAAAAAAPLETLTLRTPTGKRTLIDPEELWKEGRELAAAGKLRQALSNFELAAECDAQNGNYAAEVAYCRFQLMISPGSVTLKALKNAIRIDARSGIAYYYAGKVQQALGNEMEAEAYLERAAKLMGRRQG